MAVVLLAAALLCLPGAVLASKAPSRAHASETPAEHIPAGKTATSKTPPSEAPADKAATSKAPPSEAPADKAPRSKAPASKPTKRKHRPAPAPTSCNGASLMPTGADIALVSKATLCLIERERRLNHLAGLHDNRLLRGIATGQAHDMVSGNYFGDDSLTQATPFQRVTSSPYAVGSHGLAVAQNIGWGTVSAATPEAMVHGWMISPPHREIMLTSGYRDVGIGITPQAPASLGEGVEGATYAVVFAAKQPVED